MKSGYLEITIGPMYSGKSTKLIENITRARKIKKKFLAITNNIDTRYGNNIISTHNFIKIDAISLDNLKCLLDKNTDHHKLYIEAEMIFIEEAQFFKDLKDFVIHAVEKDKKHINITGLSGNYKREMFGQIYDLCPYADKIKKLNAYCELCADETLGHFTKRITNNDDEILIGSNKEYITVCREHYLNN